MRVFIMTDQEGVAGVIDTANYSRPGCRYYEVARELTTLEVNAAVEGALGAGAAEILVVDGHGHGSLNQVLLHREARLLAGRPRPGGFPFPCRDRYDLALSIGQHAKSNTDGGHLAHTGSFEVEELTINGCSIGETGRTFLIAGHSGVPFVFLSGDAAACAEAEDLVPGIVTAAVKEGVSRGTARGLTPSQNAAHNVAAIHLHPEKARALIRAGVERAIARAHAIAPLTISGPYELVQTMRPTDDGVPQRRAVRQGADLINVLTQPLHYEPA